MNIDWDALSDEEDTSHGQDDTLVKTVDGSIDWAALEADSDKEAEQKERIRNYIFAALEAEADAALEEERQEREQEDATPSGGRKKEKSRKREEKKREKEQAREEKRQQRVQRRRQRMSMKAKDRASTVSVIGEASSHRARSSSSLDYVRSPLLEPSSPRCDARKLSALTASDDDDEDETLSSEKTTALGTEINGYLYRFLFPRLLLYIFLPVHPSYIPFLLCSLFFWAAYFIPTVIHCLYLSLQCPLLVCFVCLPLVCCCV